MAQPNLIAGEMSDLPTSSPMNNQSSTFSDDPTDFEELKKLNARRELEESLRTLTEEKKDDDCENTYKEWTASDNYYGDLAKFRNVAVPIITGQETWRYVNKKLSDYEAKIKRLRVSTSDILDAIAARAHPTLQAYIDLENEVSLITGKEFTLQDLKKKVVADARAKHGNRCYVIDKIEDLRQKGSLQEYVDQFDTLVPFVDPQNHGRVIRAFKGGLDRTLQDLSYSVALSTYDEVKRWVIEQSLEANDLEKDK